MSRPTPERPEAIARRLPQKWDRSAQEEWAAAAIKAEREHYEARIAELESEIGKERLRGIMSGNAAVKRELERFAKLCDKTRIHREEVRRVLRKYESHRYAADMSAKELGIDLGGDGED